MDSLAAARSTPWGRLHRALMPDYNRKATAYWWTMVSIGLLVLAYCLGEVARLPREALLQIAAGALVQLGEDKGAMVSHCFLLLAG